jgi:ABC-type antimicrobial peptide transport system permease subunit
MFTIPAIILSFIICFPLLAIIFTIIFDNELKDMYAPVPSGYAVLESILTGLIIPILSSLIPIYKVLNLNLNEALDYNRSKSKSIYVEIL